MTFNLAPCNTPVNKCCCRTTCCYGDEHVKHKSILAAAVALAVTGSAWAAEADSSTELPEIIITATKRASTVQDTPISVTAISAADIASKGLTDFNSLAQ